LGTDNGNFKTQPSVLAAAKPEDFLPRTESYDMLAEVKVLYLEGVYDAIVKLRQAGGVDILTNVSKGKTLGELKVRGISQVRTKLVTTAASRASRFGDLPGLIGPPGPPNDDDDGFGVNACPSHFGGRWHQMFSMPPTDGNLSDAWAMRQAVDMAKHARNVVLEGAAAAAAESVTAAADDADVVPGPDEPVAHADPLQQQVRLMLSSDLSPISKYYALVDEGLIDERDDGIIGLAGRFHLGKCAAKDIDRRHYRLVVWLMKVIGKTGKALEYTMEPSNTGQQDQIMAAIRQAVAATMLIGFLERRAEADNLSDFTMPDVLLSANERAELYVVVHHGNDYFSTATATVQTYAAPGMDGDLIDRFSASQNFKEINSLGHAGAHAYLYLWTHLFETKRWWMQSDFDKCSTAHGFTAKTVNNKDIHRDLHTEGDIGHYHAVIGQDHKDHHLSDKAHSLAIMDLPQKAATKVQHSRDRPEASESQKQSVPMTSIFHLLFSALHRLNWYGVGHPKDITGADILPGSNNTWDPALTFNARAVTQLFDCEDVIMKAADIRYLDNKHFGAPKTATVASTCPEQPMLDADVTKLASVTEVLRTCHDVDDMEAARDHRGKPMFAAEQTKRLLNEHRVNADVNAAAHHLPQNTGTTAPAFVHQKDGVSTDVPSTKALNYLDKKGLRMLLSRTRRLDGPLERTAENAAGDMPNTPFKLHPVIGRVAPVPSGGHRTFPHAWPVPEDENTTLAPGQLNEFVVDSDPGFWEGRSLAPDAMT